MRTRLSDWMQVHCDGCGNVLDNYGDGIVGCKITGCSEHGKRYHLPVFDLVPVEPAPEKEPAWKHKRYADSICLRCCPHWKSWDSYDLDHRYCHPMDRRLPLRSGWECHLFSNREKPAEEPAPESVCLSCEYGIGGRWCPGGCGEPLPPGFPCSVYHKAEPPESLCLSCYHDRNTWLWPRCYHEATRGSGGGLRNCDTFRTKRGP